MAVFAGLDIGGTKCAAILGRFDGEEMRVDFRKALPTESLPDPERMLAALCGLIREGLRETGGDGLLSAGISCGGPLDSKLGLVCSPPNLPTWQGVPAARIVRDQLGVPARLMNDANACALAEWKFGAARGAQNAMFLTFGTGLGAGLILGGRLYEGANDMAGEIGHWRMAPSGPVGYGKSGALEGFASGGGLRQLGQMQALAHRQAGKKSALTRLDDEGGLTARSLALLAREGDPDALAIFGQSARMLGAALSMAVDLINPEVIVLGSIYARNPELFLPIMKSVIEKEALSRSAEICRIVPTMLGERIGDVAALTIAMYAREESI